MAATIVPLFSQLRTAWQPELRRAEIDGTVYVADDRRPISGPLAAFVGARFGVQDLFDLDRHEEEDRDVLALVRAYPLPSVLDASLSSVGEAQIAEQIELLLGECCPGIEWRVGDRELSGPLKKYGLLHATIPAPPDETNGQPMELELFAEISQLAGREIKPGAAWHDRWRSNHGDAYDLAPLNESLEFRVEAATYANVRYPGVGVGIYF